MTSRETNLCNGIIHSASIAAAAVGGGLAQVPTSDNLIITMKVRKAHSFRGGMKALFILILKCIFMLILYTFYDIL